MLSFSASRASQSLIGLFADQGAALCGLTTTPYTTQNVYVIAVRGGDVPGVTAAEFRLDPYPDAGGGMITASWESSLIIGDLANGLAIAFTVPQYATEVLLGRLDIMPFNDSWLGTDARIFVKESLDGGNLALVDDSFNTHQVDGGRFTFNCSSAETCACGSGSAESLSWGKVKALY